VGANGRCPVLLSPRPAGAKDRATTTLTGVSTVGDPHGDAGGDDWPAAPLPSSSPPPASHPPAVQPAPQSPAPYTPPGDLSPYAVPAGAGPAGSWDLDLAAASLRIDTGDTEAFFEALGNKLARILGSRVQVQREGGLRRNKRVARIVVDTGAARLEATRARTGPVFLAVHAVRGITLQTAEIGADEWLDRLVALVRDEATRSNDVRNALGRILES
jgi:hypothetical protein